MRKFRRALLARRDYNGGVRRAKPDSLVLALDIGSSSARSALFDQNGRRLPATAASREYAVTYRADGAAELDTAILLKAVEFCVRRTLRPDRHAPIVAVAGSAFWHSLLGLDARRQPITPIFMWSDNRGASDAARLRERFDERVIHARTGCMLRASFWPAKIMWLRRIDPRLFRRIRSWISPAAWIFEQLFGVAETSVSMASATGLFDLARLDWDEELCAELGVERRTLGGISAVAQPLQKTRQLRDAAIFTAIGDSASGNVGCGADLPGAFAINVGTSAAVRVVADGPNLTAPFGLFRYLIDEQRSVVGGAVSNAGNLHRWCARELRIHDAQASRATESERCSAAENPLDVLPFWVGERAPSWPENVRGTIAGLTQTTTADDIEQATACAVFYRLAQILELTESATAPAQSVIVSGGILHSQRLMRLLADALGRDVIASSEPEASLRGAAVYALHAIGRELSRLPTGKTIRHDRALAEKHRARRQRQCRLEELLQGDVRLHERLR